MNLLTLLTAALLTATVAVAWQILRRHPTAAGLAEIICLLPGEK